MRKILYVEQNQDGTVGGSHWCLYYIVKNIDRNLFTPCIMFYENHNLMNMFRELDVGVTIYNKPLGKRLFQKFGILGRTFNRLINLVITDLIPSFVFYSFINKNNIDIVHLNNTCQDGRSWVLACKFSKIPCITHQRIYPSEFTKNQLINANKFHTIVCITKNIRQYLESCNVNAKKVVIYDAIDTVEHRKKINKEAVEIRKEFKITKEDSIIVLAGNFQEWKGQHVAIEAIKILRNRGLQNIKLMLIGDTSRIREIGLDYYENIQNYIRNNDLEDQVIITGYRSDIVDLMHSADIVIHTSITPEPFGMVIIEAMNIGKAVISTNIGGPSEIIRDGIDGLLINPGNADELASTLYKLLHDDKLRLRISAEAVSRVHDNFDIKLQTKKLSELYTSILDTKI